MIVARQSLVTAAYDHLRAAVLDGSLAAGSRVTVRPLAEGLGLSATPIKAALAALEREGFLESIPHRGYFVPVMGIDDILELYELREAVDVIAARRAAAADDRVQLADRLQVLLERQRRLVARGDLQGYGEVDLRFHHLIWEGSGNRRLLEIAENLTAQVRLGNRLSAQAPGRAADAVAEHQGIVDAIRQGDTRAATRRIRQHVRAAGEAFRRYLELNNAGPEGRSGSGYTA